MWYRVVSLVLVLCICVFSLSLSAFAYDDVPAVTLQVVGNGTPGVIEGFVPGINPYLAPNASTTFEFKKLYVVRPKHNTFVTFCVAISPTDIYHTPYYDPIITYTVDGLANNDNWVVVHRQFYRTITVHKYYKVRYTANTTDEWHNNVQYEYKQKCYYYALKYIGPDVESGIASLDLKTTISFKNNANNGDDTSVNKPLSIYKDYQAGIEFFNIHITSDITEQIGFIYDSLDMLQSDSNDFFEELTRRNLYSYTQISYDAQGNSSIQEVVTTWHNAVLNSLKAVVAPLAEQVQQEQKAKDAGADDALDTAYDSVGSSFGALGDLSGLGSLGGFDGDTLGSAGTSGFLSWFSQDTANSIDAVPQTRQPNNIIDFYTGKIQSYREEVGLNDDSTSD